MKQGIDYTLSALNEFDVFGPQHVTCKSCNARPGEPCSHRCATPDLRTEFSEEVLGWTGVHFPWSSGDDLSGIKLREWRALAMPGSSHANNLDALSHYRGVRKRALHDRRLSQLKILHAWDDRVNKLKVKGVPTQ